MMMKDLNPDDWVVLKGTGWRAQVKGKMHKRGGTRIMLDVHGDAHEMGDVYIDDVEYATITEHGDRIELEFTERQTVKMNEIRIRITALGF